jgi:hypothetical protein
MYAGWSVIHPTRSATLVAWPRGVSADFVIAPMLDHLQQLEQVMELPREQVRGRCGRGGSRS